MQRVVLKNDKKSNFVFLSSPIACERTELLKTEISGRRRRLLHLSFFRILGSFCMFLFLSVSFCYFLLLFFSEKVDKVVLI